MAHQVTGTSHPFLQKIGKGQAITWQAMPYTTDTHSCSNKEIGIHRGHKEVIIIAMNLSDMYNPKEDMPVRNTADLNKLNKQIVQRPRPDPKINSTLQKLKLNPCDVIRPEHGLMGPRGAPCTASTSTAGRLRDGSCSRI